jgi:hypothetical protein
MREPLGSRERAKPLAENRDQLKSEQCLDTGKNPSAPRRASSEPRRAGASAREPAHRLSVLHAHWKGPGLRVPRKHLAPDCGVHPAGSSSASLNEASPVPPGRREPSSMVPWGRVLRRASRSSDSTVPPWALGKRRRRAADDPAPPEAGGRLCLLFDCAIVDSLPALVACVNSAGLESAGPTHMRNIHADRTDPQRSGKLGSTAAARRR